eukprot:6188477-Pleurochrysis_carterae.AAC.2
MVLGTRSSPLRLRERPHKIEVFRKWSRTSNSVVATADALPRARREHAWQARPRNRREDPMSLARWADILLVAAKAFASNSQPFAYSP